MAEMTRIMAVEKNEEVTIRAVGDYDKLISLAASALMKVTVEAVMNDALSQSAAIQLTAAIMGEQIKVLRGTPNG